MSREKGARGEWTKEEERPREESRTRKECNRPQREVERSSIYVSSRDTWENERFLTILNVLRSNLIVCYILVKMYIDMKRYGAALEYMERNECVLVLELERETYSAFHGMPFSMKVS